MELLGAMLPTAKKLKYCEAAPLRIGGNQRQSPVDSKSYGDIFIDSKSPLAYTFLIRRTSCQ